VDKGRSTPGVQGDVSQNACPEHAGQSPGEHRSSRSSHLNTFLAQALGSGRCLLLLLWLSAAALASLQASDEAVRCLLG